MIDVDLAGCQDQLVVLRRPIARTLPLLLASMVAGACGGTALAAGSTGVSAPICVACVSSTPVPQISPALLVARDRDLPGFAVARSEIFWTPSASVWANEFTGDSMTRANVEARVLLNEEFQEGVQGIFRARHRLAASYAVVFKTAEDATSQWGIAVTHERPFYERVGYHQSEVPGIPESIVFTSFSAGKRETKATAIFTTGRCLFIIAAIVRYASTAAQGANAPVAAAKTLNRRVQPACG